MLLSGPVRYGLKCDATRIIAVEDSDGGGNLSGLAARRVPKLYVISQDRKPFYIGVTRQTIRARLRLGFDAYGAHGYHGYAWRHHFVQAVLDVWVQNGSDGTITDLETVEAEVVFLIRQQYKQYKQWPAYQTEIHFHPSDAAHRETARGIIAQYDPDRAGG